MKAETKKSLKNNVAVIVYALIIIAVVILSDAIEIWIEPGTAEFTIVIMAFLIIWQVFGQALQSEPEKTRKKITFIMTIILIILAVLGLIVFIFYQTNI